MRDAVLPAGFVTRAVFHPDSQTHGAGPGHLARDDADPVGGDGLVEHDYVGRARGLRGVRLFERLFAAELDLSLLVDVQNLHHHLVPFAEHVSDAAHTLRSELRDMQQTVCARENLDESAEVHDLSHRAPINLADFRLGGDELDHLDGAAARRLIVRRDHDGAVVLDVDLDAGLLDDAADDLASGADDLADLLGPDFERDDTRRVARHLAARLGDRLVHDTEDVQAPLFRLVHRVAHDLARDAGDLDIHLQRCDAFARAGDLEIHIAQMVLVSENVRKNADLIALFDKPHRDAGDRRAGRHSGGHQ